MQTSQNGIDLIKSFEQLKLDKYVDAAGYTTIGWGHKVLLSENIPFSIDESCAEQLLADDIGKAENIVNNYVSVALNQNQFDACVSMAFNMGSKPFTLGFGQLLNKGHYDEAAQHIPYYDKVTVGGELVFCQGLYNRRIKEQQLFLAPVEE